MFKPNFHVSAINIKIILQPSVSRLSLCLWYKGIKHHTAELKYKFTVETYVFKHEIKKQVKIFRNVNKHIKLNDLVKRRRCFGITFCLEQDHDIKTWSSLIVILPWVNLKRNKCMLIFKNCIICSNQDIFKWMWHLVWCKAKIKVCKNYQSHTFEFYFLLYLDSKQFFLNISKQSICHIYSISYKF